MRRAAPAALLISSTVQPMAQPPRHAPASALRNLLTHEAAGGLLLIASAAVALIVANSAAAPAYFDILAIKIAGLSVLHWINDALMTLFFLMVGLEIKRELLDGQLATWPHRILPGIGAIGGMLVPALIYVAFNLSSPATIKGWGIPAATDIAFSLSVLAILGQRVPISLKVLLTALAILDDLGAIVIIALFYSGELSPLMLGGAGVAFAALVALNRLGVMRLAPYLALGIVLWLLVLKSGVHATVAGVLLALTIPLRKMPGQTRRCAIAIASAGECDPALRRISGAAGVRLCQCRRVIYRHRRRRSVAAGNAWLRARALYRKTNWHLWRRLARHTAGIRQPAAGSELHRNFTASHYCAVSASR